MRRPQDSDRPWTPAVADGTPCLGRQGTVSERPREWNKPNWADAWGGEGENGGKGGGGDRGRTAGIPGQKKNKLHVKHGLRVLVRGNSR